MRHDLYAEKKSTNTLVNGGKKDDCQCVYYHLCIKKECIIYYDMPVF